VSDDLGERYKRANARLLEWRERFKHFREWLVYLQETVWEPAVRAALHGDLGPAREKWRKGDKPRRKHVPCSRRRGLGCRRGAEDDSPKESRQFTEGRCGG
jgi:hypothetical protein